MQGGHFGYKKHPIGNGEIYYEKDRLKSLYSLMKKEAWSPAYLNERINQYIDALPLKDGFFYKRKYKEFNAGDPKAAAIADSFREIGPNGPNIGEAVKLTALKGQ